MSKKTENNNTNKLTNYQSIVLATQIITILALISILIYSIYVMIN